MKSSEMKANRRGMNVTLALAAIATISLVFNIYLGGQVASLKYKETVFGWKFFTCQTLLDDPITYATMKTQWAERRKKMIKGG